MKKILVIGASGYVGSRLIPVLLEEGFSIQAVGRSLSKLRERPWARHPQVELTAADMLERASLDKIGQGCSIAYYLVHSLNSKTSFSEADRWAAENMVYTAQGGGIDRIIYLGGLGELESHLSEHLQSRQEVGQILHAGGVPVTTLQAAMILGRGSVSFEILRHLVESLPVVITPSSVDTESQPIAISNVLGYLTGCLKSEQTAGQTFDIGGSDIFTYRRLMETFAEEAGLKRTIVSLPFLTPHLSARWVELITPIPQQLTRPLAEGLKVPMVCRDNRIRDLIPQKLFSCREAIRMALREDRFPGDPSWVGSGHKFFNRA